MNTCATCTNELAALTQCAFCESSYCARCYRAHDCPGHDAESIACVSCDVEIPFIVDALGRETRPALIGGDAVCAACAYLKPWEKPKIEANGRLIKLTFHEAIKFFRKAV